MVAVLIALKLTSLRASLRGGQATYLALGIVVGGAFAALTLSVALRAGTDPAAAFGELAILAALWLVGWVLVSIAGGDPLRPEFFALFPIERRRLAAGLLVAATVGVLPVVSGVAFAGLFVAGAMVGPLPALVGAVGTVLLLLLVIAASKVVVALSGQAMQSSIGLELAGFQRGLLVALIWIWIPVSAISGASGGAAIPLDTVGAVARLLPTGWGAVAVEAAISSSWIVAIGALAGMAALTALLVVAWGVLLDRRLSGVAGGEGHIRQGRTPGIGTLERRVPPNMFGAALLKEIRLWQRDPRRRVEIRTAIWSAAILTLLPGVFGTTVLFPFAGLAVVLVAASTTANLYGMDGSSIWVTLVNPAVERADVRARQLVWVAIFGTLGLVGTVLPTTISGQDWAWPWVLGGLPAIVGAGAGLVALLGVLVPAPLPDRRGGDPLDLGDDPRTTNAYLTQGVLATFLVPLAAVPAFLVTAIGGWGVLAGIVVGLATGIVTAWVLGRVTAWRLAVAGPELLQRMRSRPGTRAAVTHVAWQVPTRAWAAILAGCLLVFPQSLVPLLLRLSGSTTRVWFVALYLPDELQVPAIALFGALGLAALAFAFHVIREARTSSARPTH